VTHSLIVENDDGTLKKKRFGFCSGYVGSFAGVSVSVVKSSMGFGGGVLAMV
jgi:hypothetical protein